MGKKNSPGVTTAPVVKNRVAKFEFANVPRSEINEAPYNPRTIDGLAAEKLHDVLADPKLGLVEPLVWNRQTGNLVGGHQRLGQMDIIHEGENYEVPLAIIDVDPETEKKLNIILNNHGLQGDWDVPKLESLFRDGGVNPFDIGFEVIDMVNMFPGSVVEEFIYQYIPEDEAPDAAALTHLPGDPDAESMEQTADEIAEIKAARKGHKQADGEALRADHHITVVFDSADECQRVANLLRLPPDEQFFMADKFFDAVKRFGKELDSPTDAVPPDDMNPALTETDE